MTTEAIPMPVRSSRPGASLGWTLSNIATITWRNLMAILRIPEALFFSTLQPIMFVLLFRYVFAGAIGSLYGVPYVDYLMPGIFVQTVCFGAVSTAIGLSDDLQKGLVERFRALPMSRTAVLAGRTVADLCRNVFVIIIMTVVGLLVGFRPACTVGEYLAACVLMLLFGFALSWGFAYIGLAAPNTETAQVMAFPILFPFTFASSAFVSTQSMPGWLQAFANHQPVTAMANAVRQLMLGENLTQHFDIWPALAWTAAILVVCAPISVRKFRKAL